LKVEREISEQRERFAEQKEEKDSSEALSAQGFAGDSGAVVGERC
jgi:hypothetical protein